MSVSGFGAADDGRTVTERATPAVLIAGLLHFDTGGRFWTPEWDFERGQGKTVVGCLTADGREHRFDVWVCPAEAREWQALNGGISIADERPA